MVVFHHDMMKIIRKMKDKFFQSEQKIEPPRVCFVRGCEFTEDEIFCGVKKEGLAVKEDRKDYWILIDGKLTPYEKSRVIFEEGQYAKAKT